MTMSQIKKLRDMTGAGIMECKNAIDACKLSESDPLDAAIQYLRERGVASMLKRAANETNHGTFGVFEDDSAIAIIELLSETDFVANSATFQTAANQIAQRVVASGVAPQGQSLQDVADQGTLDTLMTLKENINLGKILYYTKTVGKVYYYIHNGGQNRIASILRLSDEHADGRAIAVHIACSNPLITAIRPEDVSDSDVEDEVKLLPYVKDDTRGKIRKQLSVLGSLFLMDASKEVGQLLGDVTVIEFDRIRIGW